jgi:tetratricopeptide (TPR) repeat protein
MMAVAKSAKRAMPLRAAPYALAALAALSLAGCESTSNVIKSGAGVAEVANQSPQEAEANLASLTDVVQRNPNSAEAYSTRGVAYAKIGKFPEAIADFSQAIKISPNAATLTNRALAYRQIGSNDAAMTDFNAAIAADPNHAGAYLGRANLERVQGNLDAARSDLDSAIRLNPESAQAFHARGLIYQREGNHPLAITDFDNAIDRDPFAGAPYQARGQSLIAIGQYDKRTSTPRSMLTTRTATPGRALASLMRNPAIEPRPSNPISARWCSIRPINSPRTASRGSAPETSPAR